VFNGVIRVILISLPGRLFWRILEIAPVMAVAAAATPKLIFVAVLPLIFVPAHVFNVSMTARLPTSAATPAAVAAFTEPILNLLNSSRKKIHGHPCETHATTFLTANYFHVRVTKNINYYNDLQMALGAIIHHVKGAFRVRTH
jgi:hypothetical protein